MFFWTNDEMDAMSDEEFAIRMECMPEPIPQVEQMLDDEFMANYRQRSNNKITRLIALNESKQENKPKTENQAKNELIASICGL